MRILLEFILYVLITYWAFAIHPILGFIVFILIILGLLPKY